MHCWCVAFDAAPVFGFFCVAKMTWNIFDTYKFEIYLKLMSSKYILANLKCISNKLYKDIEVI